jgi:hypothetical protein
VRNRNLASNLTAPGSVDIEIGLPSAASAGADWPPPRQFDFDANVQRGTADRKASARRFQTRLCPTTLFEVFCLHPRNDETRLESGLREIAGDGYERICATTYRYRSLLAIGLVLRGFAAPKPL